MTKRIFGAVTAVSLGMFALMMVLLVGMVYRQSAHMQLRQMRTQAELVVQAVNHGGESYFDGIDIENCRITWIDSDGTVLYDNRSDSLTMENHMEREEIYEAFTEGYGESTRYSSTILESLVYCAVRLEDGTVIRLATAQETIFGLLLEMLPTVSLMILGAILVSLLLAARLSRIIIRPLNNLDLDNPLANKGCEEVHLLLHRIDSQQRQLREQKEELRRRKNELYAVTDNMAEGLLLLDRKGVLLSINAGAAAIFAAEKTCEGGSVFDLPHFEDIRVVAQNALAGRQMEKVVELDERKYLTSANPVVSLGSVTGAVVFLFDITEKDAAETMRREFTANVSHELKTPLHAISGYAELLKSGMVKEADVVPFSGKIYEEAQRMVRLVEDIIRLSRLDEGAEDMAVEEVDLFVLAGNTLQRLESVAQRVGVRLSLEGENAPLRGIPQLLDSIIYNLCDNAIKYNKENGSVTVSVKNEVPHVVLSVVDTGIGIPVEDRERIFERFYRVDKSRSKEMGGTGLGLSIVKHGARIHNARIDLESTPGVGTVISLRFPK